MLPCMATKTATPWGPASLVEELTVPQRSGDKRFASVVQLLEGAKGERMHILRSLIRAFVCVMFPIGLLVAAIDSRRRSLADFLVGSIVVYDWSSRALWDED